MPKTRPQRFPTGTPSNSAYNPNQTQNEGNQGKTASIAPQGQVVLPASISAWTARPARSNWLPPRPTLPMRRTRPPRSPMSVVRPSAPPEAVACYAVWPEPPQVVPRHWRRGRSHRRQNFALARLACSLSGPSLPGPLPDRSVPFAAGSGQRVCRPRPKVILELVHGSTIPRMRTAAIHLLIEGGLVDS
jgi:hypothetical protein